MYYTTHYTYKVEPREDHFKTIIWNQDNPESYNVIHPCKPTNHKGASIMT